MERPAWNGKLAYHDGTYAPNPHPHVKRVFVIMRHRDLKRWQNNRGQSAAPQLAASDPTYQLSLPTVKRVHASGSLLHVNLVACTQLTTIMFPITSEANAASRRHSTATTMSPASIDRPPTVLEPTAQGPPRFYHPFSPAVIALLMPASVFGVLARLGLQALGTYDGRSIFPLAYPQAVGCLIMGIALPLKETIGD